jgi:hypothetical protein
MADTTVTNTDLRDALNRSARLSSGGTDIAERSLSGWGTLDADVVDRLVRQLEDGTFPGNRRRSGTRWLRSNKPARRTGDRSPDRLHRYLTAASVRPRGMIGDGLAARSALLSSASSFPQRSSGAVPRRSGSVNLDRGSFTTYRDAS